jgi:hypothetical protein
MRLAIAEEGIDAVAPTIDSLRVFEQTWRNAGRKQSEVDEDYKQAAHLAALAAPYRHPRLSAVKLAGDPNNPVRFKDDATADELLAEMMRRIAEMRDAGVIDLTALPPPKRRIAN